MRPSCTSNIFAADAICETAWTEAEARELLVDSWKRGPRNSAPASARPMNRMTPMMPISTFDMVTRFLLKAGSFELGLRSEEHTSELQSLMRISYAVFCLKKKKTTHNR